MQEMILSLESKIGSFQKKKKERLLKHVNQLNFDYKILDQKYTWLAESLNDD